MAGQQRRCFGVLILLQPCSHALFWFFWEKHGVMDAGKSQIVSNSDLPLTDLILAWNNSSYVFFLS